MPNAINYVEKYQRDLDQALIQGALTAELETPKVNWLDAQTFRIQTIRTGGYKSHSRNGGWNRADVTTVNKPYTLAFDRDISFFVDQADVDESNQAASAGNVTGEFTRRHATPEMDAYRFAKLAKEAQTRKQIITGALDKDSVYDTVKDAILPVRKYGTQNLIMYVSSAVMDALERSTQFQRKIDVQSFSGIIESRVTTIDGVRLVEVWDANRFWDDYDFSDGFKPAADANPINFIIINKPSVIAKAKIASVYLFAPGQHTEGDGYLYQNRLYHDVFVLDQQADGIYVSVGDKTGEGIAG